MQNIIFLMGLPRSGTTLLQRLLTVHPEIASVAEPWVLLPLLSCFNEQMTASAYGHQSLKHAIADFCVEYPEFQTEYDAHVRSFIADIYGKLAGGKKYFLDKTPRYYLVAEELHRIFPASKFVYLFRNPIAVFDSQIDTFCSGRLYRLPFIYLDLMHGLNLLAAPVGHGKAHIYSLKYEDLCADGATVLQEICAHLAVDYRPDMLNNFTSVKFAGSMGDRKQDQASGMVVRDESKKPLSMVRRFLYRRWINNIKAESWAASGYSKDEILSQLDARPRAGLGKQLDDLFGAVIFKVVLFFGYKLVNNLKRKNAGSIDLDAFLY